MSYTMCVMKVGTFYIIYLLVYSACMTGAESRLAKKVQYGRLNIPQIPTNEAFGSVLSNNVTQNDVVHICV